MSAKLDLWNDGAAKSAIVDFVARVTAKGGADFVPPDERVAVFDNDGTLWCEQPLPVQLYFALDRAAAYAKARPEVAAQEPFKSLLARDMGALRTQGMKAVLEIVKVTHTGMTATEFEASVREWLAGARHPKLGRPYTELVYAPMLEVLDYLRDNDFHTFIVSGGSADFMRVFAEATYGVPPHKVIGTTFKTHFEMRGGKPVIAIDPALDVFDDKAAKPAAIHKFIGRQPIACFGNSDGDHEMLLWTTRGTGSKAPRLGLIVHHTDAAREFAYDREHVPSGQLDKALDDAVDNGWVLADMARDWRTVFAPGAAS